MSRLEPTRAAMPLPGVQSPTPTRTETQLAALIAHCGGPPPPALEVVAWILAEASGLLPPEVEPLPDDVREWGLRQWALWAQRHAALVRSIDLEQLEAELRELPPLPRKALILRARRRARRQARRSSLGALLPLVVGLALGLSMALLRG